MHELGVNFAEVLPNGGIPFQQVSSNAGVELMREFGFDMNLVNLLVFLFLSLSLSYVYWLIAANKTTHCTSRFVCTVKTLLCT